MPGNSRYPPSLKAMDIITIIYKAWREFLGKIKRQQSEGFVKERKNGLHLSYVYNDGGRGPGWAMVPPK
jgi:hypothetical protein